MAGGTVCWMSGVWSGPAPLVRYSGLTGPHNIDSRLLRIQYIHCGNRDSTLEAKVTDYQSEGRQGETLWKLRDRVLYNLLVVFEGFFVIVL